MDTTEFRVGTLSTDWEVRSPAFNNVIMFYLRLTQDSSGFVTGQCLNVAETEIGRTEPGNPGRIDGNGALTGLRLKFNTGADVTIAGQMNANFDAVGSFVAASALFNGIPLRGLPMTMNID